MSSPRRSLVAAGLLFAWLALLAGCGGGERTGPPNVILVTLDTTRADRLGVYGGPVPTPTLERLAGEGVLFLDAASPAPLTLPAHASLFTGRYPAHHGVRHNGLYRLPESEVTLAERFRDAGYETAAFVGAYVVNRGFGLEQGFETYGDVPVERFEGGRDQLYEAERPARAVNEAVESWLEGRRDDRPVFLWVHYYDPHDPYDPPENEGWELVGEGYDRELSYVDASLGALLQRLEDEGITDGAVLVVAGDHGESLGEHGERTHGVFLYQGSLHIPLLIRAPGLLPAGRRVEGGVSLVDLAPTVLELAGLQAPEGADGRSLVGAARSGEAGEVTVFAETLMPLLEYGWSELWAARRGRYKYIEAPRPELYDLRQDPDESVNLAADLPDVASGLAASLVPLRTGNVENDSAKRGLTDEEKRRLQSLGYLSGDAVTVATDASARLDPKDGIRMLAVLEEANDLLRSGRAGEALERVEPVLREQPGNFRARNLKVLALIALRRWKEAEAEALAYVAAGQADSPAAPVLLKEGRGLLASIYALQGDAARAEREYRELLALDPRNVQARLDLARLLAGSGRTAEALELVDAVLADAPDDGMAWAVRFFVLDEAGRRDEALEAARRLADCDSGDGPTLIRAARRLLEADDPEPAVRLLERARTQDPGDADLLGELGWAELRAGKLDAAHRHLLQAARLQPRDPRPELALALVALGRGDAPRAEVHFREAVRRNPRFAPAWREWVAFLAGSDRPDEAREVLGQARRHLPQDPVLIRLENELRSGS